ncbi:type ISP restriction/modification enzyme [Dysgonomonas sp. 520]|nr:type ISP restriction/modification enzyme [Dysgonomonas sp. 520]NDW10322.1 DNA methyltransferase [Dysgonomonas sp. 520]
MLPHLIVLNEPARQACGAPDYILQRKTDNIPVAFIEAKDINDSDLTGRNKNKEQFTRYKNSLDNILFTDYLDFLLYEKGEFVESIRIAELKGEKIIPLQENFDKFTHLITRFGDAKPQRITSSAKLAEIMAGKARLLADVIEKSFSQGDIEGNLEGQMNAFKEVLIHDITPKEFADVYAQTIAYGMFAARLHDSTPDTFSRHEAATLIPKTNPFLRQLFQNVAGYDLDERISWIVDDLAETFRATDIQAVMKGFGKRTQQTDPMIHFYENFLSAYDPKLRKSRGVWYTPQAVVSFIVRAVDEILQQEFDLPMGLADTSKIKIERSIIQSLDKRYTDNKKKEQVETHKVQILDPATGTGTFLAEVVSQIYDKFQGQTGMWQGYVEEHLLPRLNGFELLMASYTMAHLKLDWLLTETGYKAIENKRLRVFLTNSLEEYHKDTGTLFAQFLAREANGANEIKRNTPVMVVLGNPPYSVSSNNKGEWIQNLIADYKKNLNERKINLDDDYIKFIRYGQHFIDENGEGVLAYISNNSFIDGVTHRQMRKSLLTTFDKIYIIDLHGSTKKKETALDGSKDENVFDIMQGVSINIFIKTGEKAPTQLGKVFHHDLYGKREDKYSVLNAGNLHTINWSELAISAPYYFFVPKDFSLIKEYEKGFKIDRLFVLNVSGFQTKRDKITIKFTEQELCDVQNVFALNDPEHIRSILQLPMDGRDWTINAAKNDLKSNNPRAIKIMYRPFDERYTFYTGKSKGFVAYPRAEIANHLFKEDNISLITCRQQSSFDFQHVFVSKLLSDMCNISSQTKETGYIFPLYLYPQQSDLLNTTRTPNLDLKIVQKITTGVGLEFEAEKSGDTNKYAPIDLLDYIYAILHSPAYRKKYKEFLKTDFPYVPYPQDAEEFHRLVVIGGELRKVHLMEHPSLSKLITQYPVAGDNIVGKPRWELFPDEQSGRIWVNDQQYFDNVPLTAWQFYIGGYQPAQKWLKDRQGRTLAYDDIMHYQRIIKALVMTNKIMSTIDN